MLISHLHNKTINKANLMLNSSIIKTNLFYNQISKMIIIKITLDLIF
jgi:hypothetical protein